MALISNSELRQILQVSPINPGKVYRVVGSDKSGFFLRQYKLSYNTYLNPRFYVNALKAEAVDTRIVLGPLRGNQ